jgi:prepilin-type N-terminal cleavage/methylation domain-containing protein
VALDVLSVPQEKKPLITRGFNLLELVIALGLLGILSTIVVVGVSKVTTESAAAACSTNARSVQTAVAAFQAANGTGVPITQAGLLGLNGSSAYLQSWPTAAGSYSISVSPEGTVYVTPWGSKQQIAFQPNRPAGTTGCSKVS